jgi:hypothetical protein
MEISRDTFNQQRRPRFGNGNPERMQLAFWEWMIRGEENPATDVEVGLAGLGLMMRDGKLKSGYGPYRARDLFNVPLNREEGPIWTFERYGATRTELPDGRVVCIGGEHEDYYDPDFYIYNDVIVFGPERKIDIYGYPKGIFPPTDSHTATLAGQEIIVIGCLGNPKDRRPELTPVHSIDTRDYRISNLDTSGTAPGWIFGHAAELSTGAVINVRDGQVVEFKDGKQLFRRNNEEFSLDTKTGVWTQTTNRNWQQWSIGQDDGGLFLLDHEVRVLDVIPQGLERLPAKDDSRREARFLVRGVPIRIIAGVKWIEIVVEGDLPDEICHEIQAVLRKRMQTLCKKSCVVA